MLRSKDLWDPYEEKMVLTDNTATHQGALLPAGIYIVGNRKVIVKD